MDGKLKTKAEFKAQYGGYTEWHNAMTLLEMRGEPDPDKSGDEAYANRAGGEWEHCDTLTVGLF